MPVETKYERKREKIAQKYGFEDDYHTVGYAAQDREPTFYDDPYQLQTRPEPAPGQKEKLLHGDPEDKMHAKRGRHSATPYARGPRSSTRYAVRPAQRPPSFEDKYGEHRDWETGYIT